MSPENTPQITQSPEISDVPSVYKTGDFVLGKFNGRVVQMELVQKDDQDPEGEDTVSLMFNDIDGTLKRGSFPVEVLNPEVQKALTSLMETEKDLGHEAVSSSKVPSDVDESFQYLSVVEKRKMRAEAEAKYGPAPDNSNYVPEPLVAIPLVSPAMVSNPTPFDPKDSINGAHRKITTIIAQPLK